MLALLAHLNIRYHVQFYQDPWIFFQLHFFFFFFTFKESNYYTTDISLYASQTFYQQPHVTILFLSCKCISWYWSSEILPLSLVKLECLQEICMHVLHIYTYEIQEFCLQRLISLTKT